MKHGFWYSRLRSFGYAFEGLRYLFIHEGNAKLHLIAAMLVIIAGFIFNISTVEWIAILICIGMVISAEGMNTALEKICDKVSPEVNPLIKIAKDVAAGAVLILALISVVIGILIFYPNFF